MKKYLLFAIENKNWLKEFRYAKENFGDEEYISNVDIDEYIEMKVDMIFGDIYNLMKNDGGIVFSTWKMMDSINDGLEESNFIICETSNDKIIMNKINNYNYDDLTYDIGIDYELCEVSRDILNHLPLKYISDIKNFIINKSVDYSKMNQRELDNLLNIAIDSKNYEEANKISKFIKENKVKPKYIKLFEDFIKKVR
jgi:hypothetical protein